MGVNIHDALVKRACQWLRGSQKCLVVVPELTSLARSSPDAFGIRHSGESMLVIECKVDRKDFLKDGRKLIFRRPELQVGTQRYYLCDPGLIKEKEVPEEWGLLYKSGRQILKIKPAPHVHSCHTETMKMMYALLRRTHIHGDLEKCFGPKWGGIGYNNRSRL